MLKTNYGRYELPVRNYADLGAFLEDKPSEGIHVIGEGTTRLDIQFRSRDADTTVVLFPAAVTSPDVTLPLFIGKYLTAELPVNVISVSDPALLIDGVATGWMLGTPGLDLTEVLPQVISHLAGDSHLIFQGSSAGGFAALNFAAKFDGSLAVAINPQTDVSNYHAHLVRAYAEHVWNRPDVTDLPVSTSVLERYRQGPDVSVVLLQGLNDDFHIAQHLVPFLDAKAPSVPVGLLVEDWGEGHAAPAPMLQSAVLQAAVEAHGDWSKVLSDDIFVTDVPDPPTVKWVKSIAG